MDEDQVKQLLAAAMAYDNRRPGDAAVHAWLEAAHRGRWTFPAALDAIHAHYAEHTDFLMPGHITAHIRAAYRQPPKLVALPAAEPASDETRSRVMAIVGDRFALPRDVQETPRRPARSSPDSDETRDAARDELNRIRELQAIAAMGCDHCDDLGVTDDATICDHNPQTLERADQPSTGRSGAPRDIAHPGGGVS